MTEQAGTQESSERESSQEESGQQEGSSQEQSSTQESSHQETSDQEASSGRRESEQETQQHETQQQTQQQAQQPSERPTQRMAPQGADGPAPEGHARRPPIDVGDLVWRIARILASVVRIVAFVLAVVLVAYIVLVLVGVNPQNGVAQLIGGVADAVVLAFRDLFLISDPSLSVVVNYGLAAVFWLLVGEFGSRLIRWLGARLT